MKPLDLSRLRSATRSTATTSSTTREQATKGAGTPRGLASSVAAASNAGSSSQYHDAAAIDFFGPSAQSPIPGWKRCATTVTVRSTTSSTQHVPYDAVSQADADGAMGSDGAARTPQRAPAADPERKKTKSARKSPLPQSQLSLEPTSASEGHPTTATATSGQSGRAARSRSGSMPHLFGGRPSSARAMGSGEAGDAHQLTRTGSGLSSVRSGHPVARARSPASSSAASHSTRASMRRRGSVATAAKYDAAAENHHEDLNALLHHDLHTSLWMATQEGPIEVRDTADPAYLMAVVDTSIPRASGPGARALTPRHQRGASLTLSGPLGATTSSSSSSSFIGGNNADRRFVTALHQIGGNRVVAGLSDGTLIVYDACTLSEVTRMRAHNSAITCMTLTTMPTAPSSEGDALTYPRASVLLTGSSDCTIAKWDGVSLDCLGRLSGNRRAVSALAASWGGCFAFSGSDDGSIRLWSLLGNEEVMFTTEEQQMLRKQGASSTPRTARGTRVRRSSSATAHVTDAAGAKPAVDAYADPTRRLFDQKPTSARRGSRRASIKTKEELDDEETLLMHTATSAADARSYGMLAGGGTDISPVRHRTDGTQGSGGAFSAATADDKDEEDGAVEQSSQQAKTPRQRSQHRIRLQKAGTRADRKPAALLQYVDEIFQTYRAFAPVTQVSSALAIEHVASYDDPHRVSWPIQGAHSERVSALAVLQDRLLVSAGRDGTAMVFALPTGELVGALPLQRNVPLTAVTVDPISCRALVGLTDGSIAAFDLTKAAMPRVFEVRPPTICFSTVFSSGGGAQQMRRFALLRCPATTAASDATGGVTAVAQSHRARAAHGPSQSYSTYRLGEPSLREIKLAMEVADRQKKCLQAVRTRAAMRANLTLEQMEAPDMHNSARVMQWQHDQCLLQHRLGVWRRWTAYRARLRVLRTIAAAQQTQRAADLRQRYLSMWRLCHAHRQHEAFEDRLFIVSHRGTPHDPARLLGLNEGPEGLACSVGENTRTAHRALACRALGRREVCVSTQLRRRFFSRWLVGILDARAQARRELAFNRLLLSFQEKESAHVGTAAVVRSAVLQRAVNAERGARLVPLLTRGTEQRCGLRLLHRYFASWHRYLQLAQRATESSMDVSNEWTLVEPLSGILVQAAEVRRRYFVRWWTAARCVNRLERRTAERDTLQREWDGMSDVNLIPASRAELLAEEAELQTSIQHTHEAKARAMDEEVILTEKMALLQRKAALRVLTSNFHDAPITTFEAQTFYTGQSATTPRRRVSTVVSRSPSLYAGGADGGDAVSANGEAAGRSEAPVPPIATPAAEEAERGHEDAYIQLASVLKALKGSALQCVRDEKQVAAAHQLTLALPLEDPRRATGDSNSCQSAAGGKTPTRARSPRLGASVNSLHSTTTTATAAAAAATTAGGTGGGGRSASTGTGSAASMWAAHPKEPTYRNVAAAFDGLTRRLVQALEAARQEVGPMTSGGGATTAFTSPSPSPSSSPPQKYRDTSAAFASSVSNTSLPSNTVGSTASPRRASEKPSTSKAPGDLQWVRAVPLATRKELVGLTLKLVALFDSFTAHSEWPVTVGGSGLSTRGATTLARLPMTWLCSPPTAVALADKAPDLLLLLNPSLWGRQRLVSAIHAPPTKLPLGTSPNTGAHRRADSMTSSASAPSGSTKAAAAAQPTGPGKTRATSKATATAAAAPPLNLTAEALRRRASATSTTTPRGTDSGSAKVRTVAPSSAARPPPVGAKGAASSSSLHAPKGGRGIVGAETCATPISSPPRPVRSASFSSVPHRAVEATALPDVVDDTEAADRVPDETLNRSYGSMPSGASTPRSSILLTPRVSVAAGATTKPYLGFRVAVNRDAASTRPVIAIREVASAYTSPSGEEVPGPAVAAGLQTGDVLSRFAGYAVTDLAAFNTIVARHVKCGAEVPVVVLRQGQAIQTKVLVGTRTA